MGVILHEILFNSTIFNCFRPNDYCVSDNKLLISSLGECASNASSCVIHATSPYLLTSKFFKYSFPHIFFSNSYTFCASFDFPFFALPVLALYKPRQNSTTCLRFKKFAIYRQWITQNEIRSDHQRLPRLHPIANSLPVRNNLPSWKVSKTWEYLPSPKMAAVKRRRKLSRTTCVADPSILAKLHLETL